MNVGPGEFAQAVNISKGIIVAQKVLWAGSSAERRRGLLSRASLEPGEGLYLVPCEWLHTFGMRFPIDVAFISPSGKVLAVSHNLKPNRISKIQWRAEGALELPVGALDSSKTEPGDIIHFLKNEAELG